MNGVLGMTKIKHLIFDVDGVLVESEHVNFVSLKMAANLFNFDITVEEDKLLGAIPTFAKLEFLESKYQRKLGALDRTIFMAKKFDFLLEMAHLLEFNPHAHAVMKNAKERGLIITCASNARPQYLAIVLERLGVTQYVDDYVGNTSGFKHKPDPAMFLHMAAKYNTEPHECLIFEDQEKNIAQAQLVGFNTRTVKSFTDVNLDGENI